MSRANPCVHQREAQNGAARPWTFAGKKSLCAFALRSCGRRSKRTTTPDPVTIASSLSALVNRRALVSDEASWSDAYALAVSVQELVAFLLLYLTTEISSDTVNQLGRRRTSTGRKNRKPPRIAALTLTICGIMKWGWECR